MVEWLGLPLAASEHAPHLDYMTLLVHGLMAVLFIGWGAFFVYTLVRFRRSRSPRADYHGVRSHYSTYSETGVAIAEVILLAGFAIPAWATRVADLPSEHEAVVVRVIGEQFAWNVHYPGPDGVFGRTDLNLVSPTNPIGLDRSDPHAGDDIATINLLNLPVNRPAIVHVMSKDVIHSFGVPVMRVKQDAIPGMSIPAWFTPTVIGEYEIACSQLCGLGHYRMRGFINILSEEDYRAWVEEELAMLRGEEPEPTAEPEPTGETEHQH